MAQNTLQPFASHLNFLDQQYDENGNPRGPERYKEIVKERYYIAKHGNISYEDTGKMTPVERDYITEFIEADLKRQKEYIEKNIPNSKPASGSSVKRS